jgi:predicted amidohydrolase
MATSLQKNIYLQLVELQKYRDDFLKLFVDLAVEFKTVIIAPSFPWEIDNSEIRNRTYVISPMGRYDFQEKNMMTRFENEIWNIKRGNQIQKLFEYKKIKFGVNICYDVEFPDFARIMCEKEAKVIFVPSCTETEKGMNRVHIGARARALENQCFVVVAQTVGDVDYSEAIDSNVGTAAVYSTCDLGFPDDGIVEISQQDKSGWIYAELDFEKLDYVRKYGNVFNFSDIKNL